MLIKNCLGVIFPKLLEGLTHPDQRDQLPSRKKKDKKQYHRVNNPGEEEDDEDEDDEEIKVGTKADKDNDGGADQNEFFNEFQSWRSNQSNKQQQQQSTELQDMKSNQKASNKQQQKQGNNLLAMSENEIEQQRNMIQDGTGDDLFKDFNQSNQQRKLPAPPRPKASPQQQKPTSRLTAESKAPQLKDLFSELETSLGSQQNNTNSNNSDQFNINMGSDGLQQTKAQQQNTDILEEKGWDEEININIE